MKCVCLFNINPFDYLIRTYESFYVRKSEVLVPTSFVDFNKISIIIKEFRIFSRLVILAICNVFLYMTIFIILYDFEYTICNN